MGAMILPVRGDEDVYKKHIFVAMNVGGSKAFLVNNKEVRHAARILLYQHFSVEGMPA